MSKSNKGITLVALVITIIVLLILAGVSISLVVGDNGIMTRAKTAGEETNKSDALESFKLAVASLTSAYFSDYYTSGSATTTDTVATYISSKIGDEMVSLGYQTITLNVEKGKNKEVTITKEGATSGTVITYDVTDDGNISNIQLKK